jgi:8-amino-3,8-dideoxy-alpha-D-manno-octulosonate transaminase
MMELQGALGLAQLRKLDRIILAKQRENMARIKEPLTKIDQVTFRPMPDPEGDIASFLMFYLPTEEKARSFSRVMSEEGCPIVYWFENSWHYYTQWEHLLGSKSVLPSGYPFEAPSGERRCHFDPEALPKTAEYLSRCLTIPINIHMEEQIPKLIKAIEKASKIL